MEKYLEEQDIINMLVDFLREFQFERKYVSIDDLMKFLSDNIEIPDEETRRNVLDIAQGVLNVLTESNYLSVKGTCYYFCETISDQVNIVEDFSEQDYVDIMVDYIKDEYQFQYATVSKETLKKHVFDNVEVSNEESKQVIDEAAQGVIDALIKSGHLRKTEFGYKINKRLEADLRIEIGFDKLEESEEEVEILQNHEQEK